MQHDCYFALTTSHIKSHLGTPICQLLFCVQSHYHLQVAKCVFIFPEDVTAGEAGKRDQ